MVVSFVVNYEENELVYVKPNNTVIASLAPLPTRFKLMTDTMNQCEPTVLKYHGGGTGTYGKLWYRGFL